MATAKRVKIENITRGDTPRLVFPITSNKAIVDLTDWNAFITITPTENPTSLTGAVVAYQPAQIDIDTGEVSYQLTRTQTKAFDTETVYYGDVELCKDPVETNTFTPVKFKFEVEPDSGVAP